jgi:fibronectin-binding autotransporter adhesin
LRSGSGSIADSSDVIDDGTFKILGMTSGASIVGSIAASSDVIDDGTFKTSGTTSGASIVTLSGDGTVTLGAQTLTLTDASTTFSGKIGGTGGLTLTAGTETLTGDDTYSGTTTINGGKLQVDDNFNGTGTVTISGGGVADFLGTFNQGVTFTGAGTLELGHATTGAVTGFDRGAALDLTNLKFATNDTVTWAQTTDDSGTLTVTHGTSSEQFTLEGIYNTGDFALIADPFGTTGTEVVFKSTGTVIIAGDGDRDADDNVSIYASSSTNAVTFEGSIGSLTLDNPSSFTGLISGFTGTGILATSDQIDLKGINYNSNSFSEVYNPRADTLTVSDRTTTAVLHFVGS